MTARSEELKKEPQGAGRRQHRRRGPPAPGRRPAARPQGAAPKPAAKPAA